MRFPGPFMGWGKFVWYLSSHFSSFVQTLLELWSVPPRPHSLSLPRLLFLLHTLPSRPSQSGREVFFLISYSHLGATLGPERTHSDLEFFFLLMKLKVMWKMGVKDTREQGQSQGHRGVWSQYCLWNFNHNKVWQENCICTYIRWDCSF